MSAVRIHIIARNLFFLYQSMSEGQTISSKTPSKYINHGWKAEIGGGERVHDTCKSGEYNWCDRVKNWQVSYEALAGHVI